MKTRAAVVEAVGQPIKVKTLDLQEPGNGEVRIKVKACGVCHSDWHLVTGETRHPLPAALGHEGAGIVDSIGENVENLKPGDHVVLNWAPYCGDCFYCHKGQPNLCTTYVEPIWAGTMLDGTTRLYDDGKPIYHYCGLASFADYVVVPAMCCVPMRKELPFEVAALIGCAVTTGIGSVLNTAKVEPGSSVAVFGVGGVGLSTIMGAVIAGATTIIAIDTLSSRLEAANDLGATHTLLANEKAVQEIQNLTQGRGADYVFEAIGNPKVQEQSLEACRPGGQVIFSGLSAMGSSTNLPGSILVRQEKTVKGSYYGSANPPLDFVRYADLFLAGKLPLDRLISKSYALEEINQAFEDMLTGKTRRGLIVF
jgi:NDMA-dependent alcohol dehydrogenase